ncbi:B3 domain-containing transcription factor abi3 [Thalictrum thalictroides]|uniref:B3 domain-containing transcription factor abi3 n=1 Tax=Thalictrum thalictroides TaxID=46969 RepID=A0A7J6VTK4_THATH|nr:B3 domain-containing transcription factor abi3 [Thalictrum thalictroides]
MKNNNSMHVHANEAEEEQGRDDDGLNKMKMIESNDDLNQGVAVNLNWEEDLAVELDKEMWFERDEDEDLNAFINYDDFPPLPDFPCISSSSSSSCSSAPVMPNNNPNKPSSSSASSSSSSASSSSVTSWIRNKDSSQPDQALLSTGSIEIPLQGRIGRLASDEYMDVMEELGGIDLFDPDDIWDPSTLFPCDGLEDLDFNKNQNEESEEPMVIQGTNNENDGQQQQKPSEDLAMVFFEWLKSNKESISAEDLRSIKLKRSTIECAAKRLGGGKEGMKQLLKLILEWVQNHQLQKKRMKEGENSSLPSQVVLSTKQNPNLNPSPGPNPSPTDFNSNSYLVPSMPQWLPHHHQQQPYIPDSTTVFPSMVYGGYMGEPVYNNGISIPPVSSTSFNNQTLIPQTWPLPPHNYSSSTTHYNAFPDQTSHVVQVPQLQPRTYTTPFGNPPYPCQLYPTAGGDRLVRLGSSATKEARKKRMARQKRFFSHSRSHSQHHQQTNETRLASDANCITTSQNPNPNWLYWPLSPSTISSPASMLMSDPPPPPPQGDQQIMQSQQFQRPTGLDRRQGFKTGPEKNLKFLLQKVLKQSDVGNLGRIVLPKKEAETYLPGLDARDGISIDMEDIGSSRIWNMRYRFWPNNKSRMYLLENTGEFVRSNGLQEGDFIVIYSDIKCGKYLIRGVKVRQPGSKSEVKRQGKTHRNAGTGASSSSTKEAVR